MTPKDIDPAVQRVRADHARFRQELKTAGYKVEKYEPRAYDERPAVRASNFVALQNIIRATTVILDWDTLGLGWIVYPAERAR